MQITFHGVRGSTPCHGDATSKYGGNTSCVSVAAPGQPPILCDLGTGARYFGLSWPNDRVFDGTVLVTHLHWDHLQGLPFFPPILQPASHLQFVAPVPSTGRSLPDEVRTAIQPPLFPVGIDELPGNISFREVADCEFMVGDVRVMSRLVPHIGATVGYRLEYGGHSVAYISDHQQPGVDVYEAGEGARALADGVDVLIHDAQYTRAEFEHKRDWGHCTFEYACWMAEQSGVGQLVLFHHDPLHDDAMIDRLHGEISAATDIDVIAAHEGLVLHLGR